MPLTKIRLSDSALSLLLRCEREFQIERFLRGQKSQADAAVFSRGHAFGKGVQVYLLTGDMDKALYAAWLAYFPDLEEEPKVTLHRTLHALRCAQRELDAILERYEVVSFKGLPAVELGIKLIIDETYYWVGFIDLVLKNRETGLYVVFEIKYTGSWLDVEAMFHNQGQGTGYSIALDQIVGEELNDYGVLYFICQDKNKEPKEIVFHLKEWSKDLKTRLKWFITLGLDVDKIKTMREIGVFPQRGGACIRYNRICPHFGTCGLTIGDIEMEDKPDPHEKDYTFTYHLDDVIKDHIRRGA